MGSALKSKARISGIDGLRGAAAIAVMFYHLTVLPEPMLPLGLTGVEIFFCLSGFILAYAYEDQLDAGMSARDFAVQRWIRLYPVYALGLALGFMGYVIDFELGGVGNPPAAVLAALARGILLFPTLTPFGAQEGPYFETDRLFPFDNPAWSLLIEAICSALFFLWRPRGPILAALLIVLGALFAWFMLSIRIVGGFNQSTFALGAPRGLFCFYAGLGVYRLWRAGALTRFPRSTLFAIALMAGGAACELSLSSYLVAVFVASPLVTALAIEEPERPRLRRLFQWLGDISYPLYLLHLPLFTLARLAAIALGGPAELWSRPAALALSPLLIGAAALASIYYDAPARRWLKACLMAAPEPDLAATKTAAAE